jgi:serine/threonine protein kinase
MGKHCDGPTGSRDKPVVVIGRAGEPAMSRKDRAPFASSVTPPLETLTPNPPSVSSITPTVNPGLLMPLLVAGAEPVPGYQLVKRLGHGGFGEVWQAIGPGGFSVAMKFIRLGSPSGEVELRSLELMKKVRHANLLGQFGAWQKNGMLIIAMELAEGTLLNRHTAAVAEGLPGIPAEELLEYMADAARGIDYLNEPRPQDGQVHGIQHRDIKPANLLLVGGCVKVADFGLAKLLQSSLASNTGSMTLAYAAPECINGTTSQYSDQYSLAVTYCHLRGNRLPYHGSPQQVMFGHLMNSPDLSMLPVPERPVVARALAKDPTKRWPNCRAFIQALKQAAQANPGPVIAPRGRKPSPAVRAVAPRSRHRTAEIGLGYTPDRWFVSFLGLFLVACITFWVSLNFDQVSSWAQEAFDRLLPPKVVKEAPPPQPSLRGQPD